MYHVLIHSISLLFIPIFLDNMALYFECGINKKALLQDRFFGDFPHWVRTVKYCDIFFLRAYGVIQFINKKSGVFTEQGAYVSLYKSLFLD